MGRPSKLSPEQWSDIERRMAAGESPTKLAKEYGVHQTQITRRVSQVSQVVRNVAKQVAEAQNALAELPPAQQYNALSLAEKFRGITMSLASGAELGAKSYHRLNAIANGELQKVDDSNVLSEESIASLKTVSVLTKVANDCATGAFNLMAASKDTVKRLNEEGEAEPDDSPEYRLEAARRMAFILHRAGKPQEPAHG